MTGCRIAVDAKLLIQDKEFLFLVFKHLDKDSLCAAELVCRNWSYLLAEELFWEKLLAWRVITDSRWLNMYLHRERFFKQRAKFVVYLDKHFYRVLYFVLHRAIQNLDINWMNEPVRTKCLKVNSNQLMGVNEVLYTDGLFLTGQKDGTLRVWNRYKMHCKGIMDGHNGAVTCFRTVKEHISLPPKYAFTGSEDGRVRLWNLIDFTLVNGCVVRHDAAIKDLAISSTLLISCSADGYIGMVNISDLPWMEYIVSLFAHRKAVNCACVDSRFVVTASDDCKIKVWNVVSGLRKHDLKGHTDGVSCLQYNYPLIASGSLDRIIRVWNIETGKCIRQLKSHSASITSLQLDNVRLASASYDGVLKVWIVSKLLNKECSADDCLTQELTVNASVTSLCLHDFALVCGTSEDDIHVWDFVEYKNSGYQIFVDNYTIEV